MKPFLITVLILVAIAAAAATLNKYERRPMNYFGKVSIIFSVFCSFSVSFSMIFLNLTLFLSAGELQKQIHGLHNESWGNKLNVLLPVVDRNERRNPLDHFNEELCKEFTLPISLSLSLYRKGASMVIAVLVIPAVVEDGKYIHEFCFFLYKRHDFGFRSSHAIGFGYN